MGREGRQFGTQSVAHTAAIVLLWGQLAALPHPHPQGRGCSPVAQQVALLLPFLPVFMAQDQVKGRGRWGNPEAPGGRGWQ